MFDVLKLPVSTNQRSITKAFESEKTDVLETVKVLALDATRNVPLIKRFLYPEKLSYDTCSEKYP
jgi:phage regulator Rha-like protein